VFLREDRATGCHASDQRQGQLHDAGMRQRELMGSFVKAAIGQQANAAR